MKYILNILMCIGGAFTVQAQSAVTLSATIGCSSSHLNNKSDEESGLLKESPKTRPEFGLTLGYHNNRRWGVEGISVGLRYVQAYQATHATFKYDLGTNYGDAYSNLRYLKLPVMANLALGKVHKFRFSASAGIYIAYLFHYQEYMKSTYYNGDFQEYTITNKDGSGAYTAQGFKIQEVSFRLEEPLYMKFDWGFLGAVGTKYDINERYSFSATFEYSYSMTTDIERKGRTYFANSNKQNYFGTTGSYWDYNSPKATETPTTRRIRSATRMFSLGLQLSLNYSF